jgi:peptidoglycan/xylan/chitin deacetylase (PgdA/CDA1 family)
MGARSNYHTQIISILLLICLLLASLPTPSNAQETTGAQTKRVMLRNDDITPWSLDALRAVNQVQIDEGVPVTLSVIPTSLFPSQNATSDDLWNTPFAQYMRSLASTTLFEIGQHGYNHANNSGRYNVSLASEFRGMPYYEQYELIENGRSIMQQAFGSAPTTFIPPYNTGDENTLRALSALGYTVYSSYEGEFERKPEGNLTLEPMQLALPFNTGDANSTFQFFVKQTEALLNDPNVKDIVIVYHSTTFTMKGEQNVDPAKVDTLRFYIQYLKTQNVTFSTLSGTSPHLDPMSAILQRVGSPWIYVALALASTGGIGILIKRKKSGK